MKKLILLLAFMATGYVAFSDAIFTPSDNDLGDLDHTDAYVWKVDMSGLIYDHIDEAKLVFKRIYDSTGGEIGDVLYIHMMDTYDTGASDILKIDDGADNGDYFSADSLVDALYVDEDIQIGGINAQDVIVTLDVELLKSFAANGNDVAFAFDPDCHFFNKGIELQVSAVPVPGALLLAGLGLPVVRWMKRRRSL